MRRLGAILLLLLPVVLPQEHCDPGLKPPTADPFAYRLRGDRCEGLYIKEVAGSAGLLLAALTQSLASYEFTAGDKLNIQWTSPANAPLRLRAVALRSKLYYRMDTVRPPGSASYVWPSDLLASLKVTSREIGLVGSVSHKVGNNTRDVYLPLRISKGSVPDPVQRYTVVLLPGADLAEVYLSLSLLGPDGRPVSSIKQGEPLKLGFYPAERPIAIALPELKSRGFYWLEAGATLLRGGSTTIGLCFFHAGG